MKRWAWATAAAFAGTVSAVGQTPSAAPPAASSSPAKGGDVVVIRTAGQPDRQLRILKVTGYGDGDSIADVQDLGSGAKYSIPAKVLAAMVRTSVKSTPTPASTPKPNPIDKIPPLPSSSAPPIAAPVVVSAAATVPSSPSPSAQSAKVYATPDANDADVVVIRTAGQPDRRVKVVRLTNAVDGEAIADVQDLATGAKYVIPSKVLATLMRAAPRTPNAVGTQSTATTHATPIVPPVRPQAPLADPATGWPRSAGPIAPTAPLTTTKHAAFRTSLPVPTPPSGSHTAIVQVPHSTPNDAPRPPRPQLASNSTLPPFAVPSPSSAPTPSLVVPASATTIQVPPTIAPTAVAEIPAAPLIVPAPAADIPAPPAPSSIVPASSEAVLPPPPIQIVEPVASSTPPSAAVSASNVRAPAEMRSISGRPASTVTVPATASVRPVVARRHVASFVRSLADSSFWVARVSTSKPPALTYVGRPLAAVRPALPMVSVPADWPSTVEKIALPSPAKTVVAAKSAPAKSTVIPASFQEPATEANSPVTPVVAVVMPRPIASALTSQFSSTDPLPLAHVQPGPQEYRVADRMDEDLKGSLSDLRTALRPATRQWAATAIFQSRYCWKPEVKAHLAQAARSDSSSAVRSHCIDLLSKLGYHEASYLDFLDEAVATASPEVQIAAKAALMKLAPK